ncbi:MAG TPA: VTT domain-containing protein [Myxococcota bacterium]|jgi:membrane protein DedA with SNARE-associated domain
MDAHAVARAAIEWMALRPAWLSIGACSLVAGAEYVVPPLPHDVVVVAAAILAAQGALNPIVLLVAVTIASTLGALAAWRIGKLALTNERAHRFIARIVGARALARAGAMYRKNGKGLLAANRFLPGLRTTLLFAAGLFNVRARDVVIYSAISALLWNALLIGAGVLLGRNIDDVLDLVEKYSVVGYGVIALVTLALIARWYAHRRARGHGWRVSHGARENRE